MSLTSVSPVWTEPKPHGGVNCFSNQNETPWEHWKWCHILLFCLSRLCICTHTVYWKGHPLRLLSHWEPTCHMADMTLSECSGCMWSALHWAPQMTKWLGVSKQPTNGPVLFQTESWEQQRRCLVSSASSARCLPASSQQTCLMVHKHILDSWLDFSLCDTSVPCRVVYVEYDQGKHGSHSSFQACKQGSSLHTGSVVGIIWKVRRP